MRRAAEITLAEARADTARLGRLIGSKQAVAMPDWKYDNLRAEYALAMRRERDAEEACRLDEVTSQPNPKGHKPHVGPT